MKKIIIPIVLFLCLFGGVIAPILKGASDEESNTVLGNGNIKLPEAVLQYEDIVKEVASRYGLENYTKLFLVIIYQESSGLGLDVMQSSESEGLQPNAITDPALSIDVGIRYFKKLFDKAENLGIKDLATIIQSYNYGIGYIQFIAQNGGNHTQELSDQFSAQQAINMGWTKYGNPQYANQVLKILNGMQTSVVGDGLTNSEFESLMNIARKYQGLPYCYGGNKPNSFDCSGLVQYCYGQIGINLNRTAQMQYEQCSIIPPDSAKPGDLVFFQGTYNCGDYITHVGIYIGNNKFYQSAGAGIGEADLNSSYYNSHFVGFGRINR